MNKNELKARTKKFALRIIRLSEKLQQMGGSTKIIAHQTLRTGTSVGQITEPLALLKAITIIFTNSRFAKKKLMRQPIGWNS